MIALLWFLLTLFASPLKSKSRLEADSTTCKANEIQLAASAVLVIAPVNGHVCNEELHLNLIGEPYAALSAEAWYRSSLLY